MCSISRPSPQSLMQSRLVVTVAGALATASLALAAPSHAATVTIPAAPTCAMKNGTNANTNFCTSAQLNLGSTSGNFQRSLLAFDVKSYVPSNAVISDAAVNIDAISQSSTKSFPVDAYAPTKVWTTGATWNKYNGTASWTTPGGDFTSTVQASNPVVGGALGWFVWHPTALVQSWLTGAAPNNGLLFKQRSEGAVANQIVFASNSYATTSKRPYMTVTYALRANTLPADYVFHGKLAGDANPGLWRANADGTNPEQISPYDNANGCCLREPVLSPDGSRVAMTFANKLWVWDISGAAKKLIYDGQPTNAESYPPQWSPDGERLIFLGDVISTNNITARGHVYTVRPDGTGLKQLNIQLPGGQTRPEGMSYSASGQSIVFVSTDDNAQNGALFMASADGSGVSRVWTEPFHSGSTWLRHPRLSPDGRTIVFTYNGDIWTIKTDGTALTRLTTEVNPNQNDNPMWAPTGAYIIYDHAQYSPSFSAQERKIDPSGTGTPSQIVSGLAGSSPATMRQAPDPNLQLAAQFEPVLRFDASEQYRPLNVDQFFGEGQHKICDSGTCDAAPMTSADDLARHLTSTSYIDIAGATSGGDAASYHSPYPECTTIRRECDTGPRSSIYYRLANSYSGYAYIDYWFFYRFNDFNRGIDQHEGDWEGVTVAPQGGNLTNPATFDFAGLSQHGTFASYLRDNLACEDVQRATPPGQGTCGTESNKTGKRLAVMVANGSHANYPKACSETILLQSCSGTFALGQFDRGYDGTKEWGRAFDNPTSTLLPLPPDSGGPSGVNFNTWQGKWGNAADGDCPGSCDAPASPFVQSVNIRCASIDNSGGCPNPGPRRTLARRATTGQAVPPGHQPVSPGLAAGSCSSWLGAGVSVVACDPAQLRRALRTASVGTRGSVAISVLGRGQRSAGGKGIAQLMGRPLRAGQQLRLSGLPTAGTHVLLHLRDTRHHRMLSAQFPLPRRFRAGLHASGRRTVTVSLALRSIGGRVTPLLSGQRPTLLVSKRIGG
jgi:Tol biopolymer transport system component